MFKVGDAVYHIWSQLWFTVIAVNGNRISVQNAKGDVVTAHESNFTLFSGDFQI